MTSDQAVTMIAQLNQIIAGEQYLIEGCAVIVFVLGALLVLKWW